MGEAIALDDSKWQELRERVLENVRDCANQRLKSSLSGLKLEPTDGVEHELDEDEDWLVRIVVHALGARFVFRVYYTVELASHFLAQKKAMKGRQIVPSLAHDFIREYCNLTAGAIKLWLQSQYSTVNAEGELVVNLPDQKPAAIEEIDSVKKMSKKSNMIVDFWHYEHEGRQLMCGVDVKVTDPEQLWQIVSAQKEEVSDEDELAMLGIDFL